MPASPCIAIHMFSLHRPLLIRDANMQVDLTLPPHELKRRYPMFPGIPAAQDVTLQAGECLYLPAGWFHEVTSYSTGAGEAHMAVNYWFHPPDNLDAPASAHGLHPYVSDFWPSLWNERVRRHGWGGELLVAERDADCKAPAAAVAAVAENRALQQRAPEVAHATRQRKRQR